MLKKLLIILFLISIIAFAGYILVKAYPDFKAPILTPDEPIDVTLEFWGLWDNSDNWKGIIGDFQNKDIRINGRKIKIKINYTKKDFSSFEKDLFEARKKNSLPDIFTINNNWLERYSPFLVPLEQHKAYVKDYSLLTFEDIMNSFPQETVSKWVYNGEVYGIPTYSDSLALYYNINLFDKAGIKNPPSTWKEFKDDARKLTLLKNEKLENSAAAIGTGGNITRSSDILALLMMQGGASVIGLEKNIDINKEIEVITVNGPEKRTPGLRAILFYNEFSDPIKEVYTWNEKMPNSIEAFAHQKTAMMFGYSYQIANLLAMSPELKYEIAPMPQIENSSVVNFTSVWTPVVSKKDNCAAIPLELAKGIDCGKLAWSFLNFATGKDYSKKYLEATGKPAARKDLIGEQINSNAKVSVFALQAETAMSYNKFDDRIDGIFSEMLDKISLDRINLENTVNEAIEKIEQLK